MKIPFLTSVLMSVLGMGLSSCLFVEPAEVYSEPGFDWNALKRDQVLMAPFMDLRVEPQFYPGTQSNQISVNPEERLKYPEQFKQSFYTLRKDIRVFGAGGAFTGLEKLPELEKQAQKVLGRERLDPMIVEKITAVNQDIRFILFWGVLYEQLDYSFDYVFRSDQKDDVVSYQSRRKFVVRMALWDSKTNRTVWMATRTLNPQNKSDRAVPNPGKYRVLVRDHPKAPGRWVWRGPSLSPETLNSLQAERREYPDFPDWRPAFQASYPSFVLSLPINPSEEKLIEYQWMTFHRPELGLLWWPKSHGSDSPPIGGLSSYALAIGTSSALAREYRLGGALLVGIADHTVKVQGLRSELSHIGLEVGFFRELPLTSQLTLAVGLKSGPSIMSLTEMRELDESDADDALMTQEPVTKQDGLWSVTPSLGLWAGDRRSGFLWGGGLSLRRFLGADYDFTKENGPWQGLNLEGRIGYTVRGF